MAIEITTPQGVTLQTEGKYCSGNITVIPKLQEKIININGDVVPDEGYAGLSKITVNVASAPVSGYVIGEPFDVELDVDTWNGTTYSELIISNYKEGPYGVQVGLPTNSSAPEMQAVIEAALTIVQVRTLVASDDGTTPQRIALTFSAVKQPTTSLKIALFGLEAV